MQMLARNPAAAYRRVELDARIEASGSADLTRLCLEEASAALAQALIALERRAPVREALTRAQSIMLWLARSVAPGHPLAGTLKQFYGGLAGQIGANIRAPEAEVIARIADDLKDVIAAAR